MKIPCQGGNEARHLIPAHELGGALERAAPRQGEDLAAPGDGPDKVDLRAEADLYLDEGAGWVGSVGDEDQAGKAGVCHDGSHHPPAPRSSPGVRRRLHQHGEAYGIALEGPALPGSVGHGFAQCRSHTGIIGTARRFCMRLCYNNGIMNRCISRVVLRAFSFLGAAYGLAPGALCLTPGRIFHVSPTPLPTVTGGRQFRTIGEAAQAVAPGDTVLIHTGVYREGISVGTSGTAARPIRFESAPAANVVVTGADRLTGWRKEPGLDPIYSIAWPYTFISGPTHTHPDDDYHALIGRAEQVFVQNYALHQVLRRDSLSRGDFFADGESKRLYVWSAGGEDLSAVPVEASTRAVLWQCRGDYVTLRGVRFRYAANAAQQGAIQFSGRHDIVQDSIVERTNGNGASFTAGDIAVERCTFQDNGQLGFGAARADRLLLTDCIVRGNNAKDFSRGWEAGGLKIVLSRHPLLDHCRILENRGAGVWFDIGNEDAEVRHCLIADNEDAGIFYEISFGLYAHDNVIVGNGLADTPGSWGAQAGICLSSSPGCRIEHNLLVANREGFAFREQGRTTPRLGAPPGTPEEAVWNHDETVQHNVIASNRDAQTWGWFDVSDERHWPKAMQEKKADAGEAAQNLAGDYAAKDARGQPVGLTLEKLRLTFADNLYSVPDGQSLFHWGVSWRRNKQYDALAAVRKELALEQGSIIGSFSFGDYLTRDFRVPAGSPAIQMACYPTGTVPDVRLGVLRGTHPTRRAPP